MIHISIYIHTAKPIADRSAPNLEILSKNFQFSTPIFKGFTTVTMSLPCTTVLLVSLMGRILVCW